MTFKQIYKSRLEQKFQNAQIQGSSPRALRNGYFFIKDVEYKDIEDHGRVPFASVLWKETAEEVFVKDVPFTVSLKPLSIDHPLDYINLVNKTILINDVKIIEAPELSAKPCIDCKYDIITQKPVFTTLQDLMIKSFGGESKNLNEAYNTFEANLGIDLSLGIDSEAAEGEVYDAPEDEK